MSRSVTFNGITRFSPGGITRVNAEALVQVASADNSIVGLIGEAEGGAPGSESGLVALADPSRATETFREGPMVDAIRLAFQPSNDPDVPGGASLVYIYKTNSSTQSTAVLPSDVANELIDSTATGGSTTTVIDTTLASTYIDDELNGKYVVLRPFTATCEVRLITDYVASTQTMTVSPAFSSAAVAANVYLVLDPEVELVAAVDTGSTTTAVPIKSVTMTSNQHAGRWIYIQDTASTSFLRKVSSNTTTTFTVSPALPAALTAGAYVEVLANSIELTSRDYGSHTVGISVDVGSSGSSKTITTLFEGLEEVSPLIGGSPVMTLLYRGGAQFIGDTAASGSTASVIQLTTGGLTVNAQAGKQVLINGEYTRISSNTASTLTLSPALSEAPGAGDAVSIRTVTGGTMRVSGSAGEATSFLTDVRGVSGDNLSLVFNASETLRSFISRVNQNSNYLAAAWPGVNQDTTLMADLDFGPGTSVSILASNDLATVGLTRNTMAVVDYINDFATHITADRADDTGSTVAGSQVPADLADPIVLTGGSRGTSSNSSFQDGFDALLEVRANSVVPLIDEDLVEEGFGSTATWASVAAQLADHVAQARGAAQMIAGERGGFIGFQGTKTQIIREANSLNDFDVALVCQNPTALDAQGNLRTFTPRMLAVIAASMRAGVNEVAEPLTHKLIRTKGVSQDSSWSPKDLTDSNDLIKAGVLFAETTDNGAVRWVRDLTTWVTDDNLAYSEGSVRDAVRYVAWGLRKSLVERFTGKKATPATIANVKDAASTYLEQARTDGIIVDSTDPATGSVIRAYHALKVSSSGDTVRLSVGLFPVPGINFILNDLYLSLATQSA